MHDGINRDWPRYGVCRKCATENSELFEYRTGFWICKANSCWDEEVERDDGSYLVKQEKLDDYRRIVNSSG